MTTLDFAGQTDTAQGGRVGTRYHAVQHLAVELRRAHDDNDYQFSILMVQFDGLGAIANRLGDAIEHDVMQTVTDVLMKDLGALDLCCRLGSDEFLLIFPGKGEQECRGLVEALGQRWTPEARTREAEFEVNIGLASYASSRSTIEGMFAAADGAMRPVKLQTVVSNPDAAVIANPAEAEHTAGTGFFVERFRAHAEA